MIPVCASDWIFIGMFSCRLHEIFHFSTEFCDLWIVWSCRFSSRNLWEYIYMCVYLCGFWSRCIIQQELVTECNMNYLLVSSEYVCKVLSWCPEFYCEMRPNIVQMVQSLPVNLKICGFHFLWRCFLIKYSQNYKVF